MVFLPKETIRIQTIEESELATEGNMIVKFSLA